MQESGGGTVIPGGTLLATTTQDETIELLLHRLQVLVDQTDGDCTLTHG
jgi:hypothetical protein